MSNSIFKFVKKFARRLRLSKKSVKYIGLFITSALLACFLVIVLSRGNNGIFQKIKHQTSRITKIFSHKSILPKINDFEVKNDYADAWTIISSINNVNSEGLIVVDLRSSEDFNRIHLKETINVPFPYMNGGEEEIRLFVSKIKEIDPNKRIILIPYSIFSTTGTEAQSILKDNKIHAELLSAGWNELYNLPNIWMPESEWENLSIIDLIEGVNR